MTKEKEMYASFVFVPQTAKVMDTVHGKCLVETDTQGVVLSEVSRIH